MDIKITAVDFDGTLFENKWPEIGAPNKKLIKYLLDKQSRGEIIILNTCRVGPMLIDAVFKCGEQGLTFDYVNENAPEIIEMFGGDTRKIYADEYIDDKMNTRFNLPFAVGSLISIICMGEYK